jgi:enolase
MSWLIDSVTARELFDARGLPSIEVDVTLRDGSRGTWMAPAGSSRGTNEAADLRDEDEDFFEGLGVSKAVANVNNEIAEALKGLDATAQEKIDETLILLDGTPDKSRLGANALVATSVAVAKAAARSKGLELRQYLGGGRTIPVSLVIVMFGGPIHVGTAGTADFQEYALYDLSARDPKEGFARTIELFKPLREYVAKKQGVGIPRLAGVAGWLSARFDTNDEALSTLTDIVKRAGLVPGTDIGLYIDVAATYLYRDGTYRLSAEHQALTREQWIDRLVAMQEEYPIIVSMEDCLDEEDWDGWRILTDRLGDKLQLVGDDFFVTNPARLKRGIETGCANAVIIKPNQVGTLSETLETIRLAKAHGYRTVLSVRSGQMFDPFMAHLCVGQSLGQAKMVEAPSGTAHLDEILRIQESLGSRASYIGGDFLWNRA